jgi:DNA-binding MurR/RpiR family transcriptional regulator
VTDQTSTPGEVMARIRALGPSLLPAERAVADLFLERPAEVIEMSSQQVGLAAGASRATVVRACQSLGYSGYQQLRVMLARDLGATAVPASGRSDGTTGTVADVVLDAFDAVGASLPAMTALLDAQAVIRVVQALADAGQVIAVGNGLSRPLAELAAQRLVAIGVTASAPVDPILQQVAARHLAPTDVLLVISGSGANATTVGAARAARAAGATVLLVTAFARSALTGLADESMVVGMRDTTFRNELAVTTRIPQFILVEALIAAVARQRGEAAEAAHALTVSILSENLAE